MAVQDPYGDGSFWKGQDGNVYVYGSDGVNSAGTWDNNTFDYWSSRNYTPIADPYASTSSGSVLSATSDYSSGGSGGSTANADDLAYLDTQQGIYRGLLDDVKTTRESGLKDIGEDYKKEKGAANLQRGRAMENFGLQREDSTRSKQQAIGSVNTNARTLADSLRRMLGMASGTGSSAYQFAAPNAVARQASQQRSRVMNNFGQNDRDLTLAETRASEDFDRLLKDILDTKKDREENFIAGILEQRGGIVDALGEIAAERARIQGGGYDSIMAAQDPYLARSEEIRSKVLGLPAQYRTAYEVDPVTVDTPQLRDYVVDRQAINAQGQGDQTSYSPYAMFLQRQAEEDNQA